MFVRTNTTHMFVRAYITHMFVRARNRQGRSLALDHLSLEEADQEPPQAAISPLLPDIVSKE